MRTTIELPPEMMRRAKARAAARGESLKALVTRAVATELGQSHEGARARSGRVQLPLFGASRGPRRRVTNLDIARTLARADVEASRRRGQRG